MTEDLRRLTAYHEAGHVVTALRLGVPFRRVKVFTKGLRGGAMQVGGAWPPELLTDFGQPENWEQAEAYLLVLLAGPNAGAMARSDLGANVQAAKRPVESDLEQARAVIKAMATARPGTDIEAYLTELEDRSCEMLGSWWPAVEAVAEALLKRGTLWPKDVARLAQEAGPSGG